MLAPEQLQSVADRYQEVLQRPSMGYRPLPAALKFHKSNKPYRWNLGGNRSSKSFSLAVETFWYASGTHPFKRIATPNVGWYATQTWDMVGQILWEQALGVLLKPYLDNGEATVQWHNRGRNIPALVSLRVPGGYSQIIFKAYEQGPGSFQGTARRYIHNDEQFSQAIFLEEISRIGKDITLDFCASMTPIIPQPWLEERLTVSLPDDYGVFEYPLDDNRISRGGFLADSEIDRIIDEWPEEVQPTRRFGKWGSFVGAVYKSFSRSVHVVQPQDEKAFFPTGLVPNTVQSVNAIDFGAQDPFVHLWACRIPHMDNAWYVYDEYYWDAKAKGVDRLLKDHYREIKARSEHWHSNTIRTWADHDRQERNELAALGLPTMPARKEPISGGIEAVQAELKHSEGQNPKKPHLYFAARCKNCIREHSGYRYPEGTDRKNAGDLPLDKDNHTCDPTRYIVFSEKTGPSQNAILQAGPSHRRAF